MSFFIAKILNLFENMPFRIIKKMGMSHLMALAIVSVMPSTSCNIFVTYSKSST